MLSIGYLQKSDFFSVSALEYYCKSSQNNIQSVSQSEMNAMNKYYFGGTQFI